MVPCARPSSPPITHHMMVARGRSGWMISDYVEPSSPTESDTASSSSPWDMGARAVVNGGEEMDPQLWSQLPGHNLMDVFSRLPLPQVFDLPVLSKEWLRTTNERTFHRLRAEAHPEVLCLVGPNDAGEVTFAALDKHRFSGRWSPNWCYKVLHRIPYDDVLFAHDGGLVALVYGDDGMLENPISVIVCNPLTDEWNYLPEIPGSPGKEPVFMQMMVNNITKNYRVDVVTQQKLLRSRVPTTVQTSAESYDSQTGEWTKLASGAVFGTAVESVNSIRRPTVFEVSTGSQKEFWSEIYNASLGPDSNPHLEQWPILVKDRIHVLLDVYTPSPKSTNDLILSHYLKCELTYDVDTNRFYDMVPALVFERGIPGFSDSGSDYGVKLFACSDYTMIVVFDYEYSRENSTWVRTVLQTRLFDGSTGEWIYLPQAINLGNTFRSFQNSFLCKLRWDISP